MPATSTSKLQHWSYSPWTFNVSRHGLLTKRPNGLPMVWSSVIDYSDRWLASPLPTIFGADSTLDRQPWSSALSRCLYCHTFHNHRSLLFYFSVRPFSYGQFFAPTGNYIALLQLDWTHGSPIQFISGSASPHALVSKAQKLSRTIIMQFMTVFHSARWTNYVFVMRVLRRL